MGFVEFSRTVGNVQGKPCISHMLKYTIRWESNGKKAPILWEKYEYQFPRLSPYHGFCYIFPCCGKFMGKPIHFPYAEVYHRMGIGWEKSTHTMGKVWLSISQTFPVPWDLLHFPLQWEIYGETHAFPICWRIPYDGNLMRKKHPYCGKSMSISFPDFPHTMGFVTFSHAVENLWGNPYISHMLKYTIGWESDGKKAPILWEKYEYQFPRLSPYHGFCCVFPYCGKFTGKPMHFPYDDIG